MRKKWRPGAFALAGLEVPRYFIIFQNRSHRIHCSPHRLKKNAYDSSSGSSGHLHISIGFLHAPHSIVIRAISPSYFLPLFYHASIGRCDRMKSAHLCGDESPQGSVRGMPGRTPIDALFRISQGRKHEVDCLGHRHRVVFCASICRPQADSLIGSA